MSWEGDIHSELVKTNGFLERIAVALENRNLGTNKKLTNRKNPTVAHLCMEVNPNNPKEFCHNIVGHPEAQHWFREIKEPEGTEIV